MESLTKHRRAHLLGLTALALVVVALTGCQRATSNEAPTVAASANCPHPASVTHLLTTAVVSAEPEELADICFGGSTSANRVWLSTGLKAVLATDGPELPIMAVTTKGGPEVRCDAGLDGFSAVKIDSHWYQTRGYACGWTLAKESSTS